MLSKLCTLVNNQGVKQNLVKLTSQFLLSDYSNFGLGKICPKLRNTVNACVHNCTKDAEDTIRKCPWLQRCKGSTKFVPVDDELEKVAARYKSAYDNAKREAMNVEIFTRNSINALAGSMKLENIDRLRVQRNRIFRVFQSIEPKLVQVEQMNYLCGAKKRNEAFAICKRIDTNLKMWQCENAANSRLIKCRLEDLESKVKDRTNTAIEIIRTCDGCVSKQSLEFCLEITAKDANAILQSIYDYAKKEIDNIEMFKRRLEESSVEIIDKMMISYDREIIEFSKYLDNIINDLKKLYSKL